MKYKKYLRYLSLWRAALALLLLLGSQSVFARIALVIGNSNYQHAPLSNPRNDARDMASALGEVGFDVTLKENLTRRAMAQAIDDFAAELARSKGEGLFYYAGHGVEINGVNFLIPLQAQINSEQTVEFESINVRRLLTQMRASGNHLNVIIIDACRNNPFARSFRRGTESRGLVRMDAPLGSIIASSTASGDVATDGEFGRNSPYTKHLLQATKKPNLKIEDVFKRVRRGVIRDTKSKQIP